MNQDVWNEELMMLVNLWSLSKGEQQHATSGTEPRGEGSISRDHGSRLMVCWIPYHCIGSTTANISPPRGLVHPAFWASLSAGCANHAA
jgi:hypothetical protein